MIDKAPHPREPARSADVSGGDDAVLEMFPRSPGQDEVERQLGARIEEAVRAFLARDRVLGAAGFDPRQGPWTATEVPERPHPLDEYFEGLLQSLSDHAVQTASPRFLGHMTMAVPYVMPLLARLISGLNQNQVKVETSGVVSAYERQALAMIHRLIYDREETFYGGHAQHPDSVLGMVVSGGTAANISALWVARNALLGARGVEEGLASAGRRLLIVGSELMHFSFDKAADLLGLGRRSVVRVPVDRRHRVDLASLERVLAQCRSQGAAVLAVVGVAGSTDSGSVDPLVPLAEIAEREGAHFHVDAAWGGSLLFSHRHRHLLDGIERADSVTLCGHKQLYLPMGLSLLLLARPDLGRVVRREASYILRPGSADLGRHSLEGSRPANVLFLHAALHLLGRSGYGRLVDDSVRRARSMAASIRRRPVFELLCEPQTNIVTYRYLPEAYRERPPAAGEEASLQAIDRLNERLQRVQRARGQSFVGRTRFPWPPGSAGPPRVALRAVTANPLIGERVIEEVLDEQQALAAELEASTEELEASTAAQAAPVGEDES